MGKDKVLLLALVPVYPQLGVLASSAVFRSYCTFLTFLGPLSSSSAALGLCVDQAPSFSLQRPAVLFLVPLWGKMATAPRAQEEYLFPEYFLSS